MTIAGATVSVATDPTMFAPVRECFWGSTHGSCGVTVTTKAATAMVLDVLEQRLRERYATAHYQALTRSGVLREATVDRMKNEILKGAGRWERLKIVLVAAPMDKEVSIVLNVDGQYAPGVGGRPPPLASYRDMEPHYYHELSVFTTKVMQLVRHA